MVGGGFLYFEIWLVVYVWKDYGCWWELLTFWGRRQGQRVKVDKEAWEQNHLFDLHHIFNDTQTPTNGLKQRTLSHQNLEFQAPAPDDIQRGSLVVKSVTT